MLTKACSNCIYQIIKNVEGKQLKFCLLTTSKHKEICTSYIQGNNLILSTLINTDTNSHRAEFCKRFPTILKRAYKYNKEELYIQKTCIYRANN